MISYTILSLILVVIMPIIAVPLINSYKNGYFGTSFRGHAVIFGWNDYGWDVVEQLLIIGKKVAIITDDPKDVELIRKRFGSSKVYVLFSSLYNLKLIGKSNIERSNFVFINIKDESAKLSHIVRLRQIYQDQNFIITLENKELIDIYQKSGVTHVISIGEFTSKMVASFMFEPDVAQFSESILSFAQHDDEYDMKQLFVTLKNPFCQMQYQQAFFELKKRYNCLLIGIAKVDKYGKKRLFKNPAGDFKIYAGDYLIIILNKKSYQDLKNVFGVEEGLIYSTKKQLTIN